MGQVVTALAAWLFATLVVVVVFFQLALAAGMPWGALAWGGRFTGRLPAYMRAVSVVSVFVLLLLGVIVLVRAGVIWPGWQPISRPAAWGVVAYSAIAVGLNAITPSRWERMAWLPVAIVMLLCSMVVATG
jgi:hypothetical protein